MTQQRADETQERILQAALQGFAQDGYDGAGVAEICRRAKVSKGAFYYHFDSKQAVFMALLQAWMTDLERSLERVASGTQSVPDRLLQMARKVQDVFQSDDERRYIFLAFWTQASRDDAVRQVVLEPYQKYQQVFEQLITQGVAEGSLAPVEPALGAQVILSLASGLFLQALLDPHGLDWAQVTEDSLRILLAGLATKSLNVSVAQS